MPGFQCFITRNGEKDSSIFFPDLETAFTHIRDELIKEGEISLDQVIPIIDNVKNTYLENEKPGNFNVWEVENDDGNIIRMFINEVI